MTEPKTLHFATSQQGTASLYDEKRREEEEGHHSVSFWVSPQIKTKQKHGVSSKEAAEHVEERLGIAGHIGLFLGLTVLVCACISVAGSGESIAGGFDAIPPLEERIIASLGTASAVASGQVGVGAEAHAAIDAV